MSEVIQEKCACPNCICMVDVKGAIKKNERHYCSEACANGHPDGVGCGNKGCGCK